MATKSNLTWRKAKVTKTTQHISRFLLTVNTNIANESISLHLQKTTEVFYDNISFFVKHRYPNIPHEDVVKQIDSYEIDPVIEIGGKFHRVHLHALITVHHRTELHLDTKKITTFFSKSLNLGGIHVDVKYIKDATFTVRRYLDKDLPSQ